MTVVLPVLCCAVCPAGYGDVPYCQDKCSQQNAYNDGTLAQCTACPQGKTPINNGRRCAATACPPGTAGEDCEIRCIDFNKWNNGSYTICQPCPVGMTSKDGKTCVFITCPAGLKGDLCDQPCDMAKGEYNDGYSFGTSSGLCPQGTSPNLARSACEDNSVDSECIPRPTDSRSLSFDCPPNWSKVAAGSTVTSTPGCITQAAMDNATTISPNCSSAWQDLGILVSGGVPDLVEAGVLFGKLVCKCRQAEAGFVLKKQLNGTFACVPEAAFLPTDGSDTDSPPITPTTPGIWYDVLPHKTCIRPQGCYDMCFFCDGRPRYHADVSWVLCVGCCGTAWVVQTGSCQPRLYLAMWRR